MLPRSPDPRRCMSSVGLYHETLATLPLSLAITGTFDRVGSLWVEGTCFVALSMLTVASGLFLTSSGATVGEDALVEAPHPILDTLTFRLSLYFKLLAIATSTLCFPPSSFIAEQRILFWSTHE